MGYAGNAEPSYIIPSTIAVGGADSNVVRSHQGINDLDFYIGNEVRTARALVYQAHLITHACACSRHL